VHNQGGDGATAATGSTRVLARQRQDLILAEVRQRGAVRVSELTTRLQVSDMTIRRDLDVLAASGLVEKVHGGATALEQRSADEPGFEVKSHLETQQKWAIANAAAAMIRPGTAVAITAGTTTWQLAYQLGDIPDLIVVTNSIRVAEALHQASRPDRTVVLTGGVRTPSDALVGPVALSAVRSLHVDQVFMGVHGMSEQAGFTTPNLVEAETNRAFVEAGQRLVILADHTKWGLRGLSTIVPLRDAHVVISDTGLDDNARETIRSHGPQLVLAQAASDTRKTS
jgi:DeoR/GlpR family transcriptional regulator of sugar metabolism